MVSVRRVAPVLLLLMALPAFAAPKQSSTPPRELHRVGDHWTAYNPPDPATYPAGAKTHTIRAGDTLWGLAQQYFGNGYLWPQLWESNTWITDAHWIYPGDVLLVEGEMTAAAEASTTGSATTASSELAGGIGTEQETTTGAGTGEAAVASSGPPIPLGVEKDVYCYGYIGDPREVMPNFVHSFEDVEVLHEPESMTPILGVADGDLIYIEGGTATGIIPGETYIAIEPGELVYHPRTKELIGRHYQYNGQIRILCAEETRARAIVTTACREIRIGSRLKPLPQIPIPLARIPDLPAFCDPDSGKTAGYIVDSDDWDLALAEGNLVQVNLGSDHQIAPGDFLIVYRDSPVRGQPRQVLGEIGILTTEAKTSTGRIMLSRRVMEVGDSVALR